jgi:NAD(P)-dependent dehydrogenase (short-subunit alcohol dehydrogenase family)
MTTRSQLIDINIMGTYFCAREAAKRMQKGSSIVMIGSMSGSVSSRVNELDHFRH